MSELSINLETIRNRIDRACAHAGRDPAEIRLVWVSKHHSREKILEAWHAGARIFGENRVQEILEKFSPHLEVPAESREKPAYETHLIGRLQKNKVRKVLPMVTAIHSIDSLDLLEVVDRAAREMNIKLDIFLQVNASGEESKSGFSPDGLLVACDCLPLLSNLRIVGLMTMGPGDGDPVRTRACFRRVADLMGEIRRMGTARNQGALASLERLSMGMSGDLEIAIEEGAHYIRIGTALFGMRTPVLNVTSVGV